MKTIKLDTGTIELDKNDNIIRLDLISLDECDKLISECALVTPDIDLEVESLYVEQINNQLLNTWI